MANDLPYVSRNHLRLGNESLENSRINNSQSSQHLGERFPPFINEKLQRILKDIQKELPKSLALVKAVGGARWEDILKYRTKMRIIANFSSETGRTQWQILPSTEIKKKKPTNNKTINFEI